MTWRRLARRWPLIVADFRREYRISADELFDLNAREFLWLLGGLSAESRFAQATRDEPVEVTGQAARNLLASL